MANEAKKEDATNHRSRYTLDMLQSSWELGTRQALFYSPRRLLIVNIFTVITIVITMSRKVALAISVV